MGLPFLGGLSGHLSRSALQASKPTLFGMKKVAVQIEQSSLNWFIL